MRKIALGVAGLVVLLIVADVGAASFVENRAAGRLQSSQHLAHKPQIKVEGFPFTQQYAAGRYHRVYIGLGDVPVPVTTTSLSSGAGDVQEAADKRTLDLLSLHLGLDDVNRNLDRLRAEKVSGEARIGYKSLSKALGARLRFGHDDRVALVPQGSDPDGAPTATPVVTDGVLGFSDSTSVDDTGPFASRISLRNLPFKLDVTSLRATSRGLVVRLADADITDHRS